MGFYRNRANSGLEMYIFFPNICYNMLHIINDTFISLLYCAIFFQNQEERTQTGVNLGNTEGVGFGCQDILGIKSEV